jgi:hypothetical protein
MRHLEQTERLIQLTLVLLLTVTNLTGVKIISPKMIQFNNKKKDRHM